MTPEKLSSGLAVAHLYRRYPAPEFFCVHEPAIASVGPYRVERRADFIALRLWGGVSRAPLGFEVKVSRADFLKELDTPEKRQPLEECCSACYFVAPSGIFRVDELPEGWGWLQLTSAGLVRKKEARHLAKRPDPGLLATLMKRMLDDRWHDRARRPVVVDVTPELFKFAGFDVTPNQLMGEARKMWSAELSAARAEGRSEEAARRSQRSADTSAEMDDFVKMICRVTDLPHWQVRSLAAFEGALRLGWNKDSASHLATVESCLSSARNIQRNAENLVHLLERR